MLSEVAKKWKTSGLIDYYNDDSGEKIDFNDEQANELSIEIEKAARYLLSLDKETISKFHVIIFPIIRRLYIKINKVGKFAFIVDVISLIDNIKEEFEKFRLDYSDLFVIPKIDIEAEFCSMFCENYIEDLKKRGII